MKIYSKTGDLGETSLIGGERISKNSIKVEAYGTVDELNSIIGVVKAYYNEEYKSKNENRYNELEKELIKIQRDLLNIGSILAASPKKNHSKLPTITESDITNLENFIDKLTDELKPLTTFILPGGGKVGSFVHYARTVCRRAERRIIHLYSIENAEENAEFIQKFYPIIIKYINRLSDALYTIARWICNFYGEMEYYW